MGSVKLEKLGKRYKHFSSPGRRLLEWSSLGFFRAHDEVWAVRGVSLQVGAGEAVGFVGSNGAGKSTLLNLVKGTLVPSEGRSLVQGRLASLELGLGFHADLSGRENLSNAGAVLGLSSDEVEALLPEIEAFAEIGSAIHDPVRTYSAGMRLRLAFSLATAVRPDILLIDEALAVGDAYFQQKCVMRIRSFREQGTTLLLASHDPASIKTLCDRAVLLDGGLVVRSGRPSDVLDYYNAIIARQQRDYSVRESRRGGAQVLRSGDRRAEIETVSLLAEGLEQRAIPVGSPVTVRVEGRTSASLEDLTVGVSIRDRVGNEIFGSNTHHLGFRAVPVDAGRAFRVEFDLALNLGVGSYSLTVALHAGSVHLEGNYEWWDQVLVFQVIPGDHADFVGCCYLPASARFSLGGTEVERTSDVG